MTFAQHRQAREDQDKLWIALGYGDPFFDTQDKDVYTLAVEAIEERVALKAQKLDLEYRLEAQKATNRELAAVNNVGTLVHDLEVATNNIDYLNTMIDTEVELRHKAVAANEELEAHILNLKSGLSIVERRGVELSNQILVKDRLLDIAIQVEVTLRNEVATLRETLGVVTETEHRAINALDAMEVNLGVATETEAEIREYIDYLLDKFQTNRAVLKIVATVASSSDLHWGLRCSTMCRIIDNHLAGYYDD